MARKARSPAGQNFLSLSVRLSYVNPFAGKLELLEFE
jgi:hypothetical protein